MEEEVQIQDIAFGGKGVARLSDGKVAFVPYVLSGERVRIRITRTSKSFCEAELLEILAPSPHRISAPCEYFGRCGGCQYQHVTYEEQLRIKQKQLADVLQRIGKFQTLPSIQVHGSSAEYGYRNKISMHSGLGGELGFYANDQRTIVDIEKCMIANDQVNAELATRRKSREHPRHLTISDRDERGTTPHGSFQQVNSGVADQLLSWLQSRLSRSTHAGLLDLYCGAGFFTLGLADHFHEAFGVDRDAQAIHAATTLASEKKLQQVHFYATSVEEKVDWFLKGRNPEQTTVLMDPPREGVEPSVVRSLGEFKPVEILYISCNPATLARDLKAFFQIAPQYELSELAMFDMFPQTSHIESVTRLKRR